MPLLNYINGLCNMPLLNYIYGLWNIPFAKLYLWALEYTFANLYLWAQEYTFAKLYLCLTVSFLKAGRLGGWFTSVSLQISSLYTQLRDTFCP